MLCVLILYISGGTYCLKSTLNDRFFKKLFIAILFTLRVFARNLLRGNRRRNTFDILFWCLAWGSIPGFTSNMATHYLLDYGDFNINPYNFKMFLCIFSQYCILSLHDTSLSLDLSRSLCDDIVLLCFPSFSFIHLND